jgi:hypothetical protein
MTHRKGIHRSTRRHLSPPAVVVTVVALLVIGSAAGVYAVSADGHSTGQSKLTADSARIGSRTGHSSHSRLRFSAQRRLVPVTATSGHSQPRSSTQPTPMPTATTPAPAPSSSSPAAAANTSCGGAPNTPGGPDPWGGCFPGPENTGVPATAKLVDVDSGAFSRPNNVLPSDNTGWEFSTSDGYIVVVAANAVIDSISDSDGIYVPPGDSLTVKDSQTGLINDEGTSLLVEDSTVNGGSQDEFPTVGGDNITVEYSNMYGGKDEVDCEGDNCTVEDSWLHDNYNSPESHQQGFLANGGSGYELRHDSVYCVGGCTADISFLSTDDDVTVSNNLLVASPDSAYCAYPGPNNSSQKGIDDIVWTDNVFQAGTGGKCATYGPVYGWYPSDGTGNVWSGNEWADGAALDEP